MRSFCLLAPVGAILFILSLSAISVAETRSRKTTAEEPVAVELFEAMRAGEIEVRVLAKDAAEGKVLIKNLTKKPLSIKLPEVFAAVPVAAQFNGNNFGLNNFGLNGGGGNGFIGGQNGGQNGINQNLGGGFQGQNGNFNGGFNGGGNNLFGGGRNNAGFNGGVFKVLPEKVGKLKMTTVCLEHGKPDPNVHIEYELKPLDSITSNASTLETVKMLAHGEIDQRSAQAAAWHLENDLSWKEMAQKIGVKHLNGRIEPFFTASHLERGQQLVEEAARRAAANAENRKHDSLAESK